MAIRVPYLNSLKLPVDIACNPMAVYAIGIKSLKTGQVCWKVIMAGGD